MQPHPPRSLWLVTLFAVWGLASSLRAQPSAAPAAAQQTAPPSTVTSAPGDPVFALAEPHIVRGEALFEHGNFRAAMTEFERAYEQLADHPKRFQVLYNIGLCHARLFSYAQALAYFDRYLAEGGGHAADAAEVRAAIAAWKRLLARMEIRSNVAVDVWLDDQLVGRGPAELIVPGGAHTLELRATGYESDKREVRLPAGERVTVAAKLRKIERYRGLSPAYFYGAAGAAVVAGGIGAYFGVRALDAHASAEDTFADERTRARNNPDIAEEIADLQLKADVFLVTGGVLALGATVLAFLTDFGGEREDARAAGRRARWSVAAGPDGGALRVEHAW